VKYVPFVFGLFPGNDKPQALDSTPLSVFSKLLAPGNLGLAAESVIMFYHKAQVSELEFIWV
jgi:hypothetical protein